MPKPWHDGPVTGGRKYFCNTRHPTFISWRNTPWRCPECGMSVAALVGPPRRRTR